MKAEPKFTPGPWNWEFVSVEKASGGGHLYLIDSTGRKIAALWGKAEEKEANAHLTAAAPELFKLLTAATHALRSYQHGNAAADLAKDIADAADELLGRAGGRG